MAQGLGGLHLGLHPAAVVVSCQGQYWLPDSSRSLGSSEFVFFTYKCRCAYFTEFLRDFFFKLRQSAGIGIALEM